MIDSKKPLCKAYAHKQRAYQSGSIGNGNGIYISYITARLLQRFLNNAAYTFGMAAGGDFGHNASVKLMLFQRRSDDI